MGDSIEQEYGITVPLHKSILLKKKEMYKNDQEETDAEGYMEAVINSTTTKGRDEIDSFDYII